MVYYVFGIFADFSCCQMRFADYVSPDRRRRIDGPFRLFPASYGMGLIAVEVRVKNAVQLQTSTEQIGAMSRQRIGGTDIKIRTCDNCRGTRSFCTCSFPAGPPPRELGKLGA